MDSEIEKQLMKDLIHEIETEVTAENKAIWGHGTLTQETAEKILEEGIVVNPGYGLTEIATPLTDSGRSSHENAKTITNQALNWAHKNAKFIVLISIPENIQRREELVETIEVEGRERIRLPSRFIKGYIDALNIKFVENPNYQQNAEPTKQEKIPVRLPKQRAEVIEIPTAPEKDDNGSGNDIW